MCLPLPVLLDNDNPVEKCRLLKQTRNILSFKYLFIKIIIFNVL